MTKINLRKKPLKDGKQSLYLDFYPPIPSSKDGKPTRREFLGLYIFEKPKSALDKTHNKETFALAENIKAQRQLDFQKGKYGFGSVSKKYTDFIVYFEALESKRIGGTMANWKATRNYLERYAGGVLPFASLTLEFCNGFKEYLLTAKGTRAKQNPISINTASEYYTKFKTALRQAFVDDLIPADLNGKLSNIKLKETHRQYLSLDELNRLAQTETQHPILKKAALFSALTGLRFSDVAKLTWGEIQHTQEQGNYLQYRQKKTGSAQEHPISEQALALLGERGNPEDEVFPHLRNTTLFNVHLKYWVQSAGITKKITFHCFRHTYATLQLSAGVNITTIQQLMGHRNIISTQVYAKVINKLKREAADTIKIDLK